MNVLLLKEIWQIWPKTLKKIFESVPSQTAAPPPTKREVHQTANAYLANAMEEANRRAPDFSWGKVAEFSSQLHPNLTPMQAKSVPNLVERYDKDIESFMESRADFEKQERARLAINDAAQVIDELDYQLKKADKVESFWKRLR